MAFVRLAAVAAARPVDVNLVAVGLVLIVPVPVVIAICFVAIVPGSAEFVLHCMRHA